ncbi:MAG: type II secretion system protein GspL [Cytophagales bacterium]|nr:type II secretion system protein GspL [Cytophagales bacterium]
MTRLIPSPLDAKSTHLVLPSARLSAHTVTLPPTPPHRLQAALAGVLEEQLLDDPADLHFAVAPHAVAAMRAGQPFEVMVCDKAWLKDVLRKYQTEGQTIAAIVPEEAAYQALGWNLAQFEFKPQARWRYGLQGALAALWREPAWRVARVGLLALVLVQMVGLNVGAWRDRAALQAGREQVASLLLQTFPDTQVVVDAPLQMTKALARLRAASGAPDTQGLEAQLAQKAKLGKPLEQIDFANGELKVSAP